MLEFFIPIEPVAQGRPKFRTFAPKGEGKRPIVSTYDPVKSKSFKQQIIYYVKKLKLVPYAKDVPLVLRLRFLLSKPKSVKRKLPVVKPDLDNFTKGVKDALKGLTWEDDSQVCDSSQRKRYVDSNKQAGIWVQIDEIKE